MSITPIFTLFDVKMTVDLFDPKIPSLSTLGRNSPAYLCPAGVTRMAQEFKKFPEQYAINVHFLSQQNDPFKSGVIYLERAFHQISTST